MYGKSITYEKRHIKKRVARDLRTHLHSPIMCKKRPVKETCKRRKETNKKTYERDPL